MNTSRLRAKGEEIELDTEEGKKKYVIKPIKNKQLLEVVELGDKNQGLQAATLLARYSLNRDPKIEGGTENPFSEEEMDEMETPFLLQIIKVAARVNGLGDMFDFQTQGVQVPTSKKTAYERNLELLKENPAKKI